MRQKFRPKRLAKITKLFFKDYLLLLFGKVQELVDSDLFEFCCYYSFFMEQDFVPDKSV